MKDTRELRKGGFTLTELVVVLIIISILAAIAVPSLVAWRKHAEFRKNEANAKTVYMAAESVLTYYRSSGQWEEFRKEVIHQGRLNDRFDTTDKRSGRIYAITLDQNAYDPDSGNAVVRLLDGDTYDKEFLNGAVGIEIDIETGQVYSAFYGTRCTGLCYGVEEGRLDMYDREYKSRKERLLGYYSVEDVTNVVELKPTRLKITTLNLINSETLSLNWSSNSRHQDLDLNFELIFYQKGEAAAEDKKLFSMTVNRFDMQSMGWNGDTASAFGMAGLKLADGNDVNRGSWSFPVTYKNGKFSLILDGMMSAKLMASLRDTNLSDLDRDKLIRTTDISITRLKTVVPELAEPQNIYATVQAISTYRNMEGDAREYRPSSVVSSNVCNTLYGNGTEADADSWEAEIGNFRHLSNIRYGNEDVPSIFTLVSRNMDWNSVGTGLYDLVPGSGNVMYPVWKENDGTLEFPSIEFLYWQHTLAGRGKSTLVSNLRLGETSAADDSTAQTCGIGSTRYLGLFNEAEGMITDLTFRDPVVCLAETDASGDPAAVRGFADLRGVGLVTGRSSGGLHNIQVLAEREDSGVTVCLADRIEEDMDRPAGIGGLVGILANKDAETGILHPVGPLKIDGLSMEGTVLGRLPNPGSRNGSTAEERAASYPYGIGGLIGYADLREVNAGNEGGGSGKPDKPGNGNNNGNHNGHYRPGHPHYPGGGENPDPTPGTGGFARLADCRNHADVSGNLFTGGIVGNVTGSLDREQLEENYDPEVTANLSNVYNDGLILCTQGHEDVEETLEGRYFGGILGFSQNVMAYHASSASGRAAGFTYDAGKKNLLKGQYVGGILGYGVSSLLNNCSTEKNGYILGSDYVGGIAGGLEGDISDSIRTHGGVAVTTNAGYVIGNRYVGGIVGKNEGNASITNCVNNGVAAGYDCYVGGIVGYNGEGGRLLDCASYLSDYSNSIFNMIVDSWGATADCVGGLVGYNNGEIEFTAASEAIAVKSVSSIVVGENYVGGLIGFNDVAGDLNVAYTLIGGRIYGYGNGVGGCIGLNASQPVLSHELTIKPYSVRGTYAVGGVVGANVVALTEDTVLDGFRADNRLGSITGEAFCGGVIGYQRTYTQEQLDAHGYSADTGLLGYLKDTAAQAEARLLPALEEGSNLPTRVMPSANPFVLTLSQKDNDANSLQTAGNNMPIRASLYTGGIVGYCEEESLLILRNLRNAGDFSRTAGHTVSLREYLDYEGFKEAAQAVDAELRVAMTGGIIGVNLENQIIDHCSNTGSMSGFTGLGGIVGFNAGGVFNCALADNFGGGEMDCVGGVAGLNIYPEGSAQKNYQDVYGVSRSYTAGTIANCSTDPSRTISGRNRVGGITGYNMHGGVLKDNVSRSHVNATGDYVGGIAGSNAGTIYTAVDQSTMARRVEGRSGEGVGGLVGINEPTGHITIEGNGTELTAVGRTVTITGGEKVGGLVGINDGRLEPEGASSYLVSEASLVRALKGYAGGIAGVSAGDITRMKNRCAQVTADRGPAGGIVAENGAGKTIRSCVSSGNVRSDQGYAGGIAAENKGHIENCRVQAEGMQNLTVRSQGVAEAGAICAVNHVYAVISGSAPGAGVVLDGQAQLLGGVAGLNYGTVKNLTLNDMPKLTAKASALTVGGAVGANVCAEGSREAAAVTGVTAQQLNFENFSGYRYLGGIVGENREGASVADSSYSGIMTESSSAAGNCYGGIVGDNAGNLSKCTVNQIQLTMKGVYTATSSSTAEQKEALASHAGGIAGKNEETGRIENCYLGDSANSTFLADSGMLGGVAGYNKGEILLSGDSKTETLMNKADTIDQLCENASNEGIAADEDYVRWSDNSQIEDLNYDYDWFETPVKVSANRMRLILSDNGNLGGITAYNAPSGRLSRCATGNWFLNNKSNAIGVGTGGIVGMNESEKDQSFLLNRAFVGRQLGSTDTNRFAGGIIGNQNNSTTEGWKLENCVNYGTVYCYKTHYSGGILGQWTGTGGTIENCRNYGNLQTTYSQGWVGASGGIVAQLYHAYDGNFYNIVSCGNYGSIFGQTGRSIDNSANDSAGILGNVTAYSTPQDYTIQVLDCVNGSGVEIYSNSMASGIVGFFSSDNTGNIPGATGNIKLNIERCRNFAARLRGRSFMGGILGERYGDQGARNTVIYDCYSVNPTNGEYSHQDRPIIAFMTGSSNEDLIKARSNYFLSGYNNRQESFTRVDLGHTRASRGGADTRNYTDTNWKPKADRVYTLRDEVVNKYYVMLLKKGANLTEQYHWINPGTLPHTGEVVYDNGGYDVYDGHLLFTTEGDQFTSVSQIIQKGSPFDTYVRRSYLRIENPFLNDAGKWQMRQPLSASAVQADGKLNLEITPYPDTDPFKYQVTVTLVTPEGDRLPVLQEAYLYQEEGSLKLPQDALTQGGTLEVEVRAVSMYDDVEISDPCSADDQELIRVLPTPDIRAELIWRNNRLTYQITLNNAADYQAVDGTGALLYPGWQVNVKGASTTVTLSANAQAGYMDGNNAIQQLLVQAVPDPAQSGNSLLASAEVSVPAYIPVNVPMIGLQGVTPAASPSVSVEGTTLSDLNVTVTLDGRNTGNVNVPPIYRAELIGNWEDGTQNVVLAQQDILTAAGGTASVTFSNLPDYVRRASNLRVRLWYAESGLGPVYTWHDLGTTAVGANIAAIAGVDDQNKPIWNYSYSEVLASRSSFNNNRYKYISNTLLQWLPAPVLENEGLRLTPSFSPDGHLQYAFAWDQGQWGNADYRVSLVGIDDNGGRISIVTNEELSQRTLTVDAEDWQYSRVELTVERVGYTDRNGTRYIGLSSTGDYLVSRRLPRPGQPSVTNPDTNELNYLVEWDPIVPETGCSAYQVYVQPYLNDGVTPGTAVPIGKAVAPGQIVDGTYSRMIALEDYAGQRVLLYVIAKADTNQEDYVDSSQGVTYELTVPSRIGAPNVSWGINWNYDRQQPVEAAAFVSGGLEAALRALDAASIPPGGSAYLLKAYIYDTQEHAQAALDAQEPRSDGYLSSYPAETEEGEVIPVEMETKPGTSDSFEHFFEDLSGEYAGKWIVLHARISFGSGNVSSPWVTSAPYRLPYLRLAVPEVASNEKAYDLIVGTSTNPDIKPIEETWTALHTVFHWDSVDYADAYEAELTGTVDGAEQKLLIRTTEETDAAGQPAIRVQASADGGAVWRDVTGVPVTGENPQDEILQFTFEEYSCPLKASYEKDGVTIYYEADSPAFLQVQVNRDAEGGFAGCTYTLALADVDSLTPEGLTDALQDTAYRMTNKVAVQANVAENRTAVQSDAYVESEWNEVSLN